MTGFVLLGHDPNLSDPWAGARLTFLGLSHGADRQPLPRSLSCDSGEFQLLADERGLKSPAYLTL